MARKQSKESKSDIGAAMLVWFAKVMKQFPEGLVTQAQASVMLCVSRMAVSRLVTRGELRAVYFPEASDDPEKPDFVGVAVGQDDPIWLKLIASISDWDKTYSFPRAVYVSFADVQRLWWEGSAKDKCKPEWQEVLAAASADSYDKLAKLQAERKRRTADSQKQAGERGDPA